MILHISNDFSGSAVYKNLVKELDDLNVVQIIYHPVRESIRVGKNNVILNTNNSKIIYSPILSKYIDRIFYRSKINKIVHDIETKIDLNTVKFIHAHTWYSDGGVAYELHKKYKIPYIIAVRNSDLNLFLKYLIHERRYGKKILLGAHHIITISAVYQKRLLSHKRLWDIIADIKEKVIIIPNGVDPYWIKSRVNHRKEILDIKNVQLLYIGKFDSGKNVFNLINAVKRLNDKNENQIKLTLIGGKGNDEKRVMNAISDNSNFNYVGRVHVLPELKTYFEKCDIFTMPSKAETFGLVYMEALLQGLPILYTKNEGIDGFYDDAIGEKVENTSVNEIENKIQRLITNYDKYNFDINEFSKNHDWKRIAKVYLDVYKKQ